MQVKPVLEIAEFLAPIAEEVGVEIVDVTFDRRTRSLTVCIDAPQGVDLDLCEKFHRAIDGPLDEFDPTFGASYTLNCSSAGLDRPFRTLRDYERHMGQKIEVHLYAPIGGKKYYEGTLSSYDGKTLKLTAEEGELTFPADKVAKACLFIEL